MLQIGSSEDWDDAEKNSARNHKRPGPGPRKALMDSLHAVFRAQAAGVIIANFSPIDPRRNVVRAARLARTHFPGRWIGVNFLEHAVATIKNLPECASGFWALDSGVNTKAHFPTEAAAFAKDFLHKKARPEVLYFGGVLSLYGWDEESENVNDHLKAAELAKDYVDILAWGTPYKQFPRPEDGEKVRERIGSHPLAVCGTMEDLRGADQIMSYADVILPSIPVYADPRHTADTISRIVTMTHDHMNAKERPWVKEWWQHDNQRAYTDPCTPFAFSYARRPRHPHQTIPRSRSRISPCRRGS